MVVPTQEQKVVDFDTFRDPYSNKVAQPIPDLLHSLMELKYLCFPKERRAYKGLFYAKFLSLCVTERDEKGFSFSLLLRKKNAVGLPSKSTESATVGAIISLQHIQVPVGDAPNVQRLLTLQGNWLRFSW